MDNVLWTAKTVLSEGHTVGVMGDRSIAIDRAAGCPLNLRMGQGDGTYHDRRGVPAAVSSRGIPRQRRAGRPGSTVVFAFPVRLRLAAHEGATGETRYLLGW